jgi:hypothetical protein
LGDQARFKTKARFKATFKTKEEGEGKTEKKKEKTEKGSREDGLESAMVDGDPCPMSERPAGPYRKDPERSPVLAAKGAAWTHLVSRPPKGLPCPRSRSRCSA